MRPVPAMSNLVTLNEGSTRRSTYGCIISHNIIDLLDSRRPSGPRILLFYNTLEGQMLQQGWGIK